LPLQATGVRCGQLVLFAESAVRPQCGIIAGFEIGEFSNQLVAQGS